MFFIFKLFFTVVGLFFLVTLVSGLSLLSRVGSQLRNSSFMKQNTPPPPQGTGEIIEGEFKVLDERER